MKTQSTKSGRRFNVVVHYLAAVVFLIMVYAIEATQITVLFTTIGIISLIAAVFSGVQIHIKTGLWRFVHAKPENLDEREIELTREVYRRSYSLFTQVGGLLVAPVAVVVNYTGLTNASPSLLPMVFGLLYFANSLPSAILAWTEKEIHRS